jgi:hypothetical protein
MPELPAKEAKSDFYFIDRVEPEQISATLLDMIKTRISDRRDRSFLRGEKSQASEKRSSATEHIPA